MADANAPTQAVVEAERPHVCLTCMKSYTCHAHLARHTLTHMRALGEGPPRPYPCKAEGCSSRFDTPAGLKAHTDTVHNKLQPYICDVEGCAKAFGNKSNLTAHKKRVHSGLKPFACDANGCEYATYSPADLTRHKNCVHLGLRPFTCSETGCGKTFSAPDWLSLHTQRVHLALRPFVCGMDGCESALVSPAARMMHIKSVHLGIRPFVCGVNGCESAFAAASGLAVHNAAVHLKLRPFSCAEDGCGATFARKCHIKSHMQYCHTAKSRSERHREEHVMDQLLTEHNLLFSRERHVPHAGCTGGGTFSRIDFMLHLGCSTVLLEVDEHQHSLEYYGVDDDVTRMDKTFESLRLDGNSRRLVFIRYNPHAFKVDGVSRKVKTAQRQARLIELLNEIANESSSKQDHRVFYLYYDLEGFFPTIFDDNEYPEHAKKWLAGCIP